MENSDFLHNTYLNAMMVLNDLNELVLHQILYFSSIDIPISKLTITAHLKLDNIQPLINTVLKSECK